MSDSLSPSLRGAVLRLHGTQSVQVERPTAHAVRVIVVGGNDREIAEAIDASLPLGYTTLGDVVVRTFDRTIRFDRG